jgi:hypothetical protein
LAPLVPVHSASSLPGVTRQSMEPRRRMDARVKPGHDEQMIAMANKRL